VLPVCLALQTTRWTRRRSPNAPAPASSAARLRCRSGPPGLSDDRLTVVTPGEPITLGAYDITLIEAEHCPPDRFPGVIREPIVPPVKVSAYKCGEAWSTLVHHRPSDRRMLIVGSAGFVRGALVGQHAEVVYLGVGQLGLQPEEYIVDYWTGRPPVGARRVVLVHWDDFSVPPTSRCASAVRRRRSRRVDAGVVPAGEEAASRCLPTPGSAATRGLTLALVALAVVPDSRCSARAAGRRPSPAVPAAGLLMHSA
jgi:hypothetical protein